MKIYVWRIWTSPKEFSEEMFSPCQKPWFVVPTNCDWWCGFGAARHEYKDDLLKCILGKIGRFIDDSTCCDALGMGGCKIESNDTTMDMHQQFGGSLNLFLYFWCHDKFNSGIVTLYKEWLCHCRRKGSGYMSLITCTFEALNKKDFGIQLRKLIKELKWVYIRLIWRVWERKFNLLFKYYILYYKKQWSDKNKKPRILQKISMELVIIKIDYKTWKV